MKKLIAFIFLAFLFSCQKPVCSKCTLHQYSIPAIPAWEEYVEFEACGDQLLFWHGKSDTLVIDNVIYITTTTCELLSNLP